MNATMLLKKIDHFSVMLDQILSIITPQHGGTFIDCTFGVGGYSKAILEHPNTKVIALDRDKQVKQYAESISQKYPGRFNFYNEKFSNLKKILKPDENLNAIIFDLGFSLFQVADHKRGFSFKSETSLDMTMGMNEISAHEAVNKLSKESLTKIIKYLGDEKDGKIIANKIIQYRIKKETIDKYHSMKNPMEMIKQGNESIEIYKKNNRNDLLEIEKGEVEIISTFLPKQLSDTETLKICKETIQSIKAQGPKDIGKVMGAIKKKYANVLDFSKVGSQVKEILK